MRCFSNTKGGTAFGFQRTGGLFGLSRDGLQAVREGIVEL